LTTSLAGSGVQSAKTGIRGILFPLSPRHGDSDLTVVRRCTERSATVVLPCGERGATVAHRNHSHVDRDPHGSGSGVLPVCYRWYKLEPPSHWAGIRAVALAARSAFNVKAIPLARTGPSCFLARAKLRLGVRSRQPAVTLAPRARC
jgi:hypothetical protein